MRVYHASYLRHPITPINIYVYIGTWCAGAGVAVHRARLCNRFTRGIYEIPVSHMASSLVSSVMASSLLSIFTTPTNLPQKTIPQKSGRGAHVCTSREKTIPLFCTVSSLQTDPARPHTRAAGIGRNTGNKGREIFLGQFLTMHDCPNRPNAWLPQQSEREREKLQHTMSTELTGDGVCLQTRVRLSPKVFSGCASLPKNLVVHLTPKKKIGGMHVRMHVCMHARMYVCMNERMYGAADMHLCVCVCVGTCASRAAAGVEGILCAGMQQPASGSLSKETTYFTCLNNSNYTECMGGAREGERGKGGRQSHRVAQHTFL